MSAFEEAIIQRIRSLEREVERLQRWERPTGGGGVTDHGDLTGLADDDHPQYLLRTDKAADSDKLDGVDGAGYVNTSATQTIAGEKTFSSIPVLPSTNPTLTNHAVRKGYADATYLGISAKAADSDKLDGVDITAFKGLHSLTDPNADRVLFWDDSAGALKWLTLGTGLTITDTTIKPSQPQFYPLTTELMSTSWDGDSFSTTSKTLIDLSSVFGVHAGVKAVYVQMAIRDSASSTTDAWIVLGADNTAGKGINFGCGGLANDMWARPAAIVPCNTDGDIYYQINASGTSTFDVYLLVWGYWL